MFSRSPDEILTALFTNYGNREAWGHPAFSRRPDGILTALFMDYENCEA